MPRELRSLVPFEIAAVLAIAVAWPFITWAELLPYALPLIAVASVARWVRGRSWIEVTAVSPGALRPLERFAAGIVAGAVGLVLALFVGTPVAEAISNHVVEWSQYGFVRGNPMQIAAFALYVGLAAAAAELALRGWIVERVLELSPAPPVLGILVGAIAEGLLTPGGFGVRFGAAVFGIGLGWIYVAGGRNVTAPVFARVVFVVGALLLEGFKIIG